MKEARKGTFVLGSLVVAAMLGLAAPAFAQEPAPAGTPPAETPPAAHHRAGGSDMGGLGVGAAMFVSGLLGPQVAYDFGIWHLEGMLAFDRREVGGGMNPPDATTFLLGASGWYHLHQGDSSDFSVGGGFGLLNTNVNNGGPSNTAFEFEPGVQARVFVTQNVAVHGRLGLVLAFGDNVGPLQGQIAINGLITSGFGFTYFFR